MPRGKTNRRGAQAYAYPFRFGHLRDAITDTQVERARIIRHGELPPPRAPQPGAGTRRESFDFLVTRHL